MRHAVGYECLNVNWFLSLEDAKEKIQGSRPKRKTVIIGEDSTRTAAAVTPPTGASTTCF